MASPQEMMDKMVGNLSEKTGHELSHWLKVVQSSGELKHNSIIKYLKTNHNITHGYANLIAFKFRETTEKSESPEEWVKNQYTGPKNSLRPMYDKLVSVVQSFGNDVDVSPRKSYVSIRRSKQFAIFKASTKTRLDVGLILKGETETERLKSGKQFSGMMTHHVEIYSMNDIDTELKGWLKSAYTKA
ncbi:MAG: DUF4287 domain-containing protein [Candidatus Marinimicrobia bacterium]|nr:DUF4287 domain-containing protein [Candidatus Neomarinimicrobiota bacterium]